MRTLASAVALTLWLSSPALCQPAKDGAKQKPATAVLPVVGVGGVKKRYVKRLQKALDHAGREQRDLTAVPDGYRMPDRRSHGTVPCAEDPACLQAEGRALGADRVITPTLGDHGRRDFVVNMRVLDVQSGELVVDEPKPVDHSDLKRVASGFLSSTVALAGQPLDVLRKRRQEQQAQAQKAHRNRELLIAQAELSAAARAAGRGAGAAQQAADPRLEKVLQELDPELEIVSAEQLAHEEVERQRRGASAGGAHNGRETKAGTLHKAGIKKKDESWNVAKRISKYRKAAPKKSKGPHTWNARRVAFADKGDKSSGSSTDWMPILRVLFPLLLGFPVGFAGMHFAPSVRLRRPTFGTFSTSGNTRQAAEAGSLMIQCSKKLTPGIAVSTESEQAMPFRFAMAQGGKVHIDVEFPKKQGMAPFRRGASLCLQFVHEGGAGVCSLQILRADRSSSKLVRVVLDAPTHVAPVVLPSSFCVPIADRKDLNVIVREGSNDNGREILAAATHVSDDEIRLAVEDVTEFGAGTRLHVAVKVGAREAKVLGIVRESGEIVSVRVHASANGGKPLDFAKLVKQLKLDWLANVRSA